MSFSGLHILLNAAMFRIDCRCHYSRYPGSIFEDQSMKLDSFLLKRNEPCTSFTASSAKFHGRTATKNFLEQETSVASSKQAERSTPTTPLKGCQWVPSADHM